ncbi:hypothetical protein NA57DRAFT_74270 [Rhizodiscina lignyota]|uniref:Mitochondrial inner membrane protein COX18 n=1 Tax=Rhizodiscina lignyota TaxID=1504668 RepID=A0A9P4IF91_9PEZI|nr:hypothetical protein NA57DRAFT_74270 [Rhizodiscina lignyota]
MKPLLRPSIVSHFQSRLSIFPHSVLQLPSESRALLFRQRVASFHASTHRQVPVPTAEALNWLEHACFDAAHNLHAASGIPWAYIIPLTAVGVRVLLFPFAVWNRRAQQRYLNIQPLLQAWLVKFRHSVYMNHAGSKDVAFLRRELAWQMAGRKKFLTKTWKCGWWRRSYHIFLQLPLFVSWAEVYRRMAGMKQGFFSELVSKAVPESVSAAVNPWLGMIFGEATSVKDALEPSLATEGMLWFQDLSVADPTGYLSGIVMGLTCLNVLISTRRAGKGRARINYIQRGLQVAVIGATVAVYPWTLGMPAAVMLYWASSLSTNIVSHVLMDLGWRLRAPPMAAKRKARIPTKIGGNA